MISKRTFLLIGAVLAVTSASILQPTDLVDEAEEQLNQLKTIVQGEILVAHDALSNQEIVFGTNSANVANEGAVALQQEHDAVIAQVDAIKDLAHSAGKDVSSCTDVREQTLNRLPQRYVREIGDCISGIGSEARRVTEQAKYLVDIAFNTVSHLEYQLRQCRGEILCISPLLTEISLDKIRLPQNIRTEVQASDGTLTVLKLSTQSCSDEKVSAYGIEAYSIVDDIAACVDRILN